MTWVFETVRTFFLLQRLRANVHLTPAALRSTQDRLLREVVAHAYQNIPFYRRFWDEAGFDALSFSGLDELGKIPILNRDVLDDPERQEAFLQRGIEPEQCTFLDTTGTSGKTLRIWKQPREEGIRRAVGLRIWLEHGFRWHFSTVDFQRTAGTSHFLQHFGIAPKTWILCDVPVPGQLQRFLAIKADVVVGTATALRRICHAIEEAGVRPKPPRIVFCAGEIPDEETRHVVRRVLFSEMFGIYGQSEVGYVAWQCEQREGFHINADTHLVEVMRNGKPAGTGELGHIVLTDLYARTMPFIRYDTKDLAMPAKEPCGCGRSLPVLGSIEGRASGSIVCPDRRLVTTRAIVNHMWEVLRLGEYRVIQDEEGTVRLQIISKTRVDVESRELKSASAHLGKLLHGLRIHVELAGPWQSDQAWKTHTVISTVAAQNARLRA